MPQGILFVALPTWLAANGQSTDVVAMAVAAAGLPWSFKFLAGFVMDRFSWLPMGRRRPWLVGSQTGIFLVLAVTAAIDPLSTQTAMILAFVLCLSAFTAIHDVALDALVVDLTPDHEMGKMNGFMFAGKVFGIAGGMAITSYLLEHFGLRPALLGMGALFAIPALAAVLIRKRAGEKLLPWTRGAGSPDLVITHENWRALLSVALRNLLRPQSLVVGAVMFSYGIHQNLNDTTMSLFAIRELEWSQARYSSIAAIFNVAAGIFCFAVGGSLVDRVGPRRMAFWSGLIALPLMGGYLLDTRLWEDERLFIAWTAAKGIPIFLFYLANLVMAMRVTAQEAAATSFAIFMAIPTMGFMVASALLPLLEDFGGFQAMFGASAVLIFIAGMLATLLDHRCGGPGGLVGNETPAS